MEVTETTNSADEIDRHWTQLMSIDRVPHKSHDLEFVAQGKMGLVETPKGPVQYHDLGDGLTVLLVHGIYSNFGNMIPIASALLANGFRVVLFDAPGHGDSPGTTTDTPEAADVILQIANEVGGIDYVVAHSQGGVWAAYAHRFGLSSQGMVLIGTAATHRTIIDKFAAMHGLDDKIVKGLEQRITSTYGPDAWSKFSPSSLMRDSALPGLIIHCSDDKVIPASDAEATHSAWPGTQLDLVSGVGHFHILKSPAVIDRIVAWLVDRREKAAPGAIPA